MVRYLMILLLVVGCASRSELAETRALLEECRSDKVAAQGATLSCEERYEREVRQWENMESVVSEVIPKTLEEFRDDRQEILDLVPEQARDVVEGHLDELGDVLGRGFQVLREENEAVLLELEVAQSKLDGLEARTDSIDSQATAINATLEGSLRSALEGQAVMRRQATAVIQKLHAFDLDYLSDRDSDQRLKLSRRQREALENFHDAVVADLSALGSDR